MKSLFVFFCFLFTNTCWSQSNVSDVEITNLNHENLTLSEVISKDKNALISVGGTWCKPCLLQKPFVASLEKQYPQYLEVVFLFSRDTAKKVKTKFNVSEFSTDYFLVEESEIFQLAVVSYPTHILVNKEGQVIKHDVSLNDVGKFIK